MALDPSIPLSGHPFIPPPMQIQSPLDRYQRVLTLRGLMEQSQARQLEIEQKQQEMAQQQREMKERQAFADYLSRTFGSSGADASQPASVTPPAMPTPPGGTVAQTAPAIGEPTLGSMMTTPPAAAPGATTIAPNFGRDVTAAPPRAMSTSDASPYSGVNLGEIVSRFPTYGPAFAKNYAEFHKNQLENEIKQHDLNAKSADELGRIAASIRDARDPAARFPAAIMEAVSNGLLKSEIGRQMLADGYDRHKDDIDAFIVKAQTGKDYSETQKTNLQAAQEEQKKVAVLMRNVSSQEGYDKLFPTLSPGLRTFLGPTFSPELKSVVGNWDVTGAQLPKAQLDQIQVDAVRLAAARSRGDEAYNAALAKLGPTSRDIFANAKTPLEVMKRAQNPEQFVTGDLNEYGKVKPYPAPVQTQRETEWRLRLEQQNDPLGLLKSTPAPAAAAPGGSAPAGSAPEGSVSAFQSPGPGQEPRMIWIGPDGSKYTQPPSSAPTPAPAGSARPRYSQDLTGDAVLTTLPGAVAQQVKAIAEGRMAIPSGQALRTPYWQQMMGLVGQYDPSFDVNNPGKRLATAKDFTSGKSAQQVNALNTVVQHIDRLSQSADKLNNTRFPSLNVVGNWLAYHAGHPNVKTFEADKKAVVDELTRVWRGTGGNEGDIKSWAATLDAADSPSSLHSVIAEMGHLLEGKLDALRDQYQEGMGTIAKGRQMITSESRTVLDRLEQKAGGTQSYKVTATGPNGHRIGSNDGKTWFDLTTGRPLH